jgi:hypothetical protein
MSVTGPWMALRQAHESGVVRLREGQPGLPLEYLFGLRVQAQVQPGTFWFKLLNKEAERPYVAIQFHRMSAE